MQGEVPQLRVGDQQASLVASLIELGFDAQAGCRSGVADQFDEGLEGAERTPAPLLRDVAEESVLDLVPFARARGEMRHVDAEAQVVGQPLQRRLPAARPIPVAAAGVGGDVERVGRWVRLEIRRLIAGSDAPASTRIDDLLTAAAVTFSAPCLIRPVWGSMLDMTSCSRSIGCVAVLFFGLLVAFSGTACNSGPTEPTLDDLVGIHTGRWRGNINGWEVVLDVQAKPGNVERWVPVGLDGTGTALNPATGEIHRLTVFGQTVGATSTSFHLSITMVTGTGGVILSGGQHVGMFSGGVSRDGRTWPGYLSPSHPANFNALPIFGPGEHSVRLIKD